MAACCQRQSMNSLSKPGALATTLHVMAVGRIALGAGSLLAPSTLARMFGSRSSPELDYMTRVFGARAIALGTAYLMAGPRERARLQRLCLGVDISDTVAGLSGIGRNSGPTRHSLAAAVAVTGPYALIGALRLLTDLRAPSSSTS